MALVEIARMPNRIAAESFRNHLLALEGDWLEIYIFDAETSSLGLGPMIPARIMVDEGIAEYLRDQYHWRISEDGGS